MSDEELPPLVDPGVEPDVEFETELFTNFVAHMDNLAAQAAAVAAQSIDHSGCTVEGCNYKRVATIKANAQLLDELRREVRQLDQKLDEVLVDLAPVQTMLAAVKLLTTEVDELRKTVRGNRRELLSWQIQ